jgi:hypothetical protein
VQESETINIGGIMNAEQSANLRALLTCNYPGRIIGFGISPDERDLLGVTVITGRSDASRNRKYVDRGLHIETDWADPSKQGGDPSLIIYPTMMIQENGPTTLVVSNGKQTEAGFSPRNLADAMTGSGWSFEPDAPNFTPRITARARWNSGHRKFDVEFVTMYRKPDGTMAIKTATPTLKPGIMTYTRTYVGDGEAPLDSFLEFPEITVGDNFGEELFKGITSPHLVAVATCKIPITGGYKPPRSIQQIRKSLT